MALVVAACVLLLHQPNLAGSGAVLGSGREGGMGQEEGGLGGSPTKGGGGALIH